MTQTYAELMAAAKQARVVVDAAEAKRLYAAAAAAAPSEAEPYHHLGRLLVAEGRLDEAEAAYRRALALAPDAASTKRVLAVLLLSQGRYAEGFDLFQARHDLPDIAKPPLPYAEWRGEPVAGKRLLIWPEQGFGDQIQFARFAPVLQAMGADVTLLCRRELHRLFAQSLPVTVLAASGAVEFPDPDYWVMTMSLAWRLGMTPETLPNAPYLRSLGTWPPMGQGPGLRIGLAAAGNPANAQDAARSLPPGLKARLMDLPATVVDLDPKATGAKDFADTAALMDQLDLVISVDTAPAHLAGALGKPCWVMLPAIWADWRWLRGRTDSPWYPSLTLYRQTVPGDWAEVVDRVERDVRAIT